jgi:dihydroorotate dehydrogenase
MSMLPYALARPFLFGLDPEHAHEVTLGTLARLQNTPLQCTWSQARVSDPVTVAGLQFPNRVGLAAGLDKNGRCIDGLARWASASSRSAPSRRRRSPAIPKPRMFRLPQANALINRLGFNNDGLDAFLANVRRAKFRQQGGILGLNIGKNARRRSSVRSTTTCSCLDGVYPHADYVTVNISSPNTKNLRALQSDDALDALLGAVQKRRAALARQHGRRVPIFVKIAPDLDAAQIEAIAARCSATASTA